MATIFIRRVYSLINSDQTLGQINVNHRFTSANDELLHPLTVDDPNNISNNGRLFSLNVSGDTFFKYEQNDISPVSDLGRLVYNTIYDSGTTNVYAGIEGKTLRKYDINGNIDTNFESNVAANNLGSQDGVQVRFGQNKSSINLLLGSGTNVRSSNFDLNGNLLSSGSTIDIGENSNSSSYWSDESDQYYYLWDDVSQKILRYDETTHVKDTTWESNTPTIADSNVSARIKWIEKQSDGKFVLLHTGVIDNNGNSRYGFDRLNTDGSLDTTWDGFSTTDDIFGNPVVNGAENFSIDLETDEIYVCYNSAFRNYQISKLDPDGNLLNDYAGVDDQEPDLRPTYIKYYRDEIYLTFIFDGAPASGVTTQGYTIRRQDVIVIGKNAGFAFPIDDLTAFIEGAGVRLDWDNLTPPEFITDFNGQTEIYRSTSPTSGFTLIDTISASFDTYLDTINLIPGTTYYYQIRYKYEIDGQTEFSDFSNTASVVYFDLQPPTDLTLFSIFFDDVDLTWVNNEPSESGLTYQIQSFVDGQWIALATVDYLTTDVTLTLLLGETYTLRVVAFLDFAPDTLFWDGESITFTMPDNLIPPPYSELENPFTVVPGTCGNNDCRIIITDYPIYKNYYNFTLTDIDGNTYQITQSGVLGFYGGLESGYYFLDVIPITKYLRDTFQARWIAATDADTTVVVTESIVDHQVVSIKSVGQRWNSSASLTSNQVGDWEVYRENPIQVADELNTDSITITNLQPDYTYYYQFKSDESEECKFLGSFDIKCLDNITQPGIQKVFIAPYTTNSSIITDQKVSGFTQSLTWYQLPTDPSNSFTEGYSRDAAGVYYSDALTIEIANDGKVDWDDIEFVLDKTWIVVFQDNNNNYWVFGHDNGAQSDVLSKTTGGNQQTNSFTLGFVDPQADGVLMALNKTYAEQNIL